MATYKLVSRKTGQIREGLSLEQALLLTKMTHPQFMQAFRHGHPGLIVIQEDDPAKTVSATKDLSRPQLSAVSTETPERKRENPKRITPGFIIAFLLLTPILALVIAGIAPVVARWLFGWILLGAIIGLFRPKMISKKHTRMESLGAIYICMIGVLAAFGHKTDSELDKLREASPSEYLAHIQDRKSDQFWLDELAALDPDAHADEISRREAEAEAAARLAEQEKADRLAAQAAEREQEARDYIVRIEREIASIPDHNPREYTDNETSILLGLALVGAWAEMYDEGASLSLNKQQEATRQRFRQLVIETQKKTLPILRDAYGPILRQQLWEHDTSAKTFGEGFATVEFIGGMFAANRNIKEFQAGVTELLHMFRFKQARYKWYEGDDEYTYYTLDSPADGDLIVWTKNGRFRRLS